jgi:hypothetical protein
MARRLKQIEESVSRYLHQLDSADRLEPICPADEVLTWRYATEEGGLINSRYWAGACASCPLKAQCTTGTERCLDENPQAMRTRRETVEHPYWTIKMRMGATHFLMKRLKNIKTEMALSVLAYNQTRVMNIIGIRPLMAAIQA